MKSGHLSVDLCYSALFCWNVTASCCLAKNVQKSQSIIICCRNRKNVKLMVFQVSFSLLSSRPSISLLFCYSIVLFTASCVSIILHWFWQNGWAYF